MKKVCIPMRDLQQDRPAYLCAVCGREVYGADGTCLYCEVYEA